MTLANKLTLGRILAAPVVLVLLLLGRPLGAFWLYTLTSLTDAVDGMVARRFSQETRLGALLDPLADKLLMVCVFPGLVLAGLVDAWVLAVFVFRDLIVSLGWALTYILLGDVEPHTRPLGKLSTGGQMVLAAAALLGAAYPSTGAALNPLIAVLTPAAVAVTTLSMLDYLIVGSRRFGP